jgi:hypothetical protein
LGNRSILADPRNKNSKDFVNLAVKYRESFRPFAPSILEDQVNNYFDYNGQSSYMLMVARVKKELCINKKQNITIHSYIDDITSKETDMIELIDNTSKGKKSIFISNKEDEPLSFCLAKKTIVNSKIIQTSVIKYQNNNTKFLDNLYSVSSIEYTNKNLMVGFEYTTLGKLTTNNKKSETSNMYISGYLKYNNFSNFKALASHLLNISDFSSKAILEIEYKYKVLNFNLKHIVYNGDVNTQFGDIKTNKFADKVQFLVYSSFKF